MKYIKKFENISNLKTIKISKVYHVGHMDIVNKSEYSLEGRLSISKNPEE